MSAAMTPSAGRPPETEAHQTSARLRPSFLRTLRGIGLLTWKSQFALRRLPLQAISLLALPLLVYFTVSSSPEKWALSHALLGAPGRRFHDFETSLRRGRLELTPDQRRRMRIIFQEEFARTAQELSQPNTPEVATAQANEAIQSSYGRIGQRIAPLLSEAQMDRFRLFQQRAIQQSQLRASEPLWTRTAPFYRWLIDFYFFVLLPLNCVRLCGGLIRDDLQTDTLGFLTTRPVSRSRLLIAKYLSQTAALQALMLLETLLFFAAGRLRQIPSLGGLLPLFLGTQLLAVFAWSTLGTLLGLLTKRTIAAAVVYGLIVEFGIGRIPTNINTLSVMRHLKRLLAHNAALQNLYHWPATSALFSVGALALASGLFLALAAALFTFLECHPAAEMQK